MNSRCNICLYSCFQYQDGKRLLTSEILSQHENLLTLKYPGLDLTQVRRHTQIPRAVLYRRPEGVFGSLTHIPLKWQVTVQQIFNSKVPTKHFSTAYSNFRSSVRKSKNHQTYMTENKKQERTKAVKQAEMDNYFCSPLMVTESLFCLCLGKTGIWAAAKHLVIIWQCCFLIILCIEERCL